MFIEPRIPKNLRMRDPRNVTKSLERIKCLFRVGSWIVLLSSFFSNLRESSCLFGAGYIAKATVHLHTEGHPDKVCDLIGDSILDVYIHFWPFSLCSSRQFITC